MNRRYDKKTPQRFGEIRTNRTMFRTLPRFLRLFSFDRKRSSFKLESDSDVRKETR